MRVESSQGIKLTGIYKGIVLKHLPAGKIKLFIPGIYDDKWNSYDECLNLPDCTIAAPLFGGNNTGNGVFSYPNIGSILLCYFDNGDQNYPIAFASLQGGDMAQEQYAEAKVITNDDSVEELGDDARVHKIITDKSSIKMWESGKIQIKVFADREFNRGDEVPTAGCLIDISEAGTVTIKTSTQVHIESPEIKLDCSNFNLNADTITVTASQSTQWHTQTLKIDSDSMTEITTPTVKEKVSSIYNLESPNINLDGTSGHTTVKGGSHTPIFL